MCERREIETNSEIELCNEEELQVDEDGYVEVRLKSTGETGKMLLEECIALNLCTPPGLTQQPSSQSPQTASAVSNEERLIQVWGELDTKLLLSLYADNLALIGPQKPFSTKKALWKYIATKINEECGTHFTPIQVEGRLKTVLKRTKKSLNSNKISGGTCVQTAYDREVQQIVGLDDSIVPDFMISAGMMKRKRTTPESGNKRAAQMHDAGPSCSSAAPRSTLPEEEQLSSSLDIENDVTSNANLLSQPLLPENRKKKSIQERFLALKEDLFKKKEENKERRHKEKMESLKFLSETLRELTNKL